MFLVDVFIILILVGHSHNIYLKKILLQKHNYQANFTM